MKQYIIIYKGTGEKQIVPEKVGLAILQAKSPKVKFGNELLDLAIVGRCLPLDEYYLQSPSERPEVVSQARLPEPRKYSKVERVRALEQLCVGVKKFINENSHTSKSVNLLALINRRLQEARLLPIDAITENPLREIKLEHIRF